MQVHISVDKHIFIYGPSNVKTSMSLQYMSFSIQYLAKKKKKKYIYIYNMLISSIWSHTQILPCNCIVGSAGRGRSG